MEIPDPKKRKVKNQNDHNIYQLNYKRWRIYCRGDGQEKGKPVHKFGEIFGRTMLLSIFEVRARDPAGAGKWSESAESDMAVSGAIE